MREVNRSSEQGVGSPIPISAALAAHELKSPLVLIRQLALDIASAELDISVQQDLIEQVVQVSSRALRLTGDMTKSSALTQTLFTMEPVNPRTICDEVSGELKRLYALHDKTLKIKRMRLLPPVVANRDLLRRVLLGFADNALHYSNVDGVVEVQAQLLRSRGVVRLGVRDYGPKIPATAWHKITNGLGSQQTVHSRPESSGLGLYIAHQFATAMQGRIGATRHRDGASFYIELPISNQLSLL